LVAASVSTPPVPPLIEPRNAASLRPAKVRVVRRAAHQRFDTRERRLRPLHRSNRRLRPCNDQVLRQRRSTQLVLAAARSRRVPAYRPAACPRCSTRICVVASSRLQAVTDGASMRLAERVQAIQPFEPNDVRK
jgi:hypothetical protein